jgi:tetratricopeptide (TPR) repeat protein
VTRNSKPNNQIKNLFIMKNLFISLLLLFSFIYAQGQQPATPTLNYGALQKKLEKSNLDINNAKKAALPKTWLLRGELFQDIYNVNIEFLRYGMSTMETKLFMKEPTEVKTVEEGGIVKQVYVYPRINLTFENDALTSWKETEVIHPDPLPEALAAYNKALELDVKGGLKNKIKENLEIMKKQFEAKAILGFTEGDYDASLTAFENIMEVSKASVYEGYIDTIVIYNAALAAKNAGRHDKAIQYFRKAIELGYGGSDSYYLLKSEYILVNDSNAAIRTLEEGFKKYPDTSLILIEIVNYYLTSGDVEKGLVYLELAEKAESSNPSIYFAKGTLYEKSGNKEKALEAYNQAIEIDSEYFNAYFNIGALYFNNAVELYEQANKLEDLKAYNTAKAIADDELKKAIQPMEKAYQINPEERAAIETLQTIYYRLQMMDKYEEMKKKLSEM